MVNGISGLTIHRLPFSTLKPMSTITATPPTNKTMRAFLTLWVGQALSLLGSQLVQFALIWYLTSTTGSATILAVASLVGLLPQVILGPFIGPLIDRWNRKRIMLAADAVIGLSTALLAVLFWTDSVEIWQILILVFIRALGGAFHHPAFSASTVLMVPEQHLTRVQGLNQALMGSLNIIGAPLGALLLAVLPMQSILAIDIVTALIAIGVLIFIKVPQPVKEISAESESTPSTYKQDLIAGFRYVRQWRGLMYIIGIAVLLNFLLSPAFALLPLLVTDHFNGEALQLGVLESAMGFGILLGGILLGIWGGFKRRIVTTLTGIIVLGSGVIMLGAAPSTLFWLAVSAMFVVGLAQVLANGPLAALFQAIVAPEMQGRVMTLVGSLSMAMTPLGLMVAGPLSDLLNVRVWFIIAGSVCLILGVGAFFVPTVMQIENNHIVKEVALPNSMREMNPEVQ